MKNKIVYFVCRYEIKNVPLYVYHDISEFIFKQGIIDPATMISRLFSLSINDLETEENKIKAKNCIEFL